MSGRTPGSRVRQLLSLQVWALESNQLDVAAGARILRGKTLLDVDLMLTYFAV